MIFIPLWAVPWLALAGGLYALLHEVAGMGQDPAAWVGFGVALALYLVYRWLKHRWLADAYDPRYWAGVREDSATKRES